MTRSKIYSWGGTVHYQVVNVKVVIYEVPEVNKGGHTGSKENKEESDAEGESTSSFAA